MFDWRRLLRYARRHQAWPGQAARRLTINRAYYGAFHVARQALRAHGMAAGDTRFHRQVWDRYSSADVAHDGGDDAWHAIAELGRWLQQERTRADYDGTAVWSRAQCTEIVQGARDLAARIDALPAAPTR